MTGLIAIGLMGMAVFVTLFPIPVWVSRARRRRALPSAEPEPVEDSLRELERRSPSLGGIVRDARIVSASLDEPIDAADDVRVSAPYLKWQAVILTSVSQGWATDVVQSFERARADAVRLVRQWLDSVDQLGEDDRRTIDTAGVAPKDIDSLVRDVESLVIPRDVVRSRALFIAVRDAVSSIEYGLLTRRLTPYR